MSFKLYKLFNNLKKCETVLYNFRTVSNFDIHKKKHSEINLKLVDDPDVFGTLSKQTFISEELTDEGDIKEENYHGSRPLSSQKLTIKQYADIIKQYLKHKRLREAIDVLRVRMLTIDRVQPENYIYNILIGACADVGYTKEAFSLYNEMKKRQLIPTGDTYTCLFTACVNSPWQHDGKKLAHHLRNIMIEKGIQPNLTNYNAMIKAFGRCGDLNTAFQIVDEMKSKKIKIRVHTFNHLLQACISDKVTGLRHALIVWRKMLLNREKPNIYSFNLMLKCVKECNLGSEQDILELIDILQKQVALLAFNNRNKGKLSEKTNMPVATDSRTELHYYNILNQIESAPELNDVSSCKDLILHESHNVNLQSVELINNKNKLMSPEKRNTPNLLSKGLQMENVQAMKVIHNAQEKFAVIGGQEDFLKEMESYSVKPDIKTITQMLFLIDETQEAELKLLETVKSLELNVDIDFYNMLMKKRCYRKDYESALEVMKLIEKEAKYRRKRYQHNKKLWLKPNIMTYGMLAMTCKSKEAAEKLLADLQEKKLKVNIEILGTLFSQAKVPVSFKHAVFIMNIVRAEELKINDVFAKHLEEFIGICDKIAQRKTDESTVFLYNYDRFKEFYAKWSKDVDIDKALIKEHPWQQFKENCSESIQKSFKIIEPKRFYKRDRKYVKYIP